MLSVYIQKSLFNKVAASVYAFGPLFIYMRIYNHSKDIY